MNNNSKFRKENEILMADSLDSLASVISKPQRNTFTVDSTEATENSIQEVLRFFRIQPESRKIESDNYQDLYNELDKHGIIARSVELDDGWRKNALGVMLGKNLEDGSAIAFIPNKLSGYRYFDAEHQRYRRVTAKIEKQCSKEAMVFYSPLPNTSLGIKDLFRYSIRMMSVPELLIYLFIAAAVAVLGTCLPYLYNVLFERVYFISSQENLYKALILALSSFMLSSAVLKLFRDFLLVRISSKLSLCVENAVIMRLMTLPSSFFRQYSAGNLSDRAANVEKVCSSLVTSVLSTSITLVFSLFYLVNIVYIAGDFLIPVVIILLCMIILSVATTVVQERVNTRYMAAHAANNGLSYNMLTGIQKIKTSGIEKRIFARWLKSYTKEARIKYNPPKFIMFGSALNLGLSVLGNLAVCIIAISNKTAAPDYYAFTIAFGMLVGAFSSFSSIVSTISEIKPSLKMAEPILRTEPEYVYNKKAMDEIEGNIEAMNIRFRYADNTPYVLDNISFKINKGEFIAITGTSGCGKTTLLRLLQGLDIPQEGTIYYDDTDMRELDIKSLRRHIGVVMQNDRLFPGDLMSNISICAPWISEEEAMDAAEKAGIADEIKNRPMGLHTPVSDTFGSFSGGQKQRIIIARAVASKPEILYMDEATSALDNVSQKKVMDSLKNMNCTRVVIAHRLSTIMGCDRILFMDKGKIVEEGTYEELMTLNGKFAEMAKRQMA